jgi:hypothetical protein
VPLKRPGEQRRRPELTAEERNALAERAAYVGSPEHKDLRWWGGLPKGLSPRPKKLLTTICPLVTEADRVRATGLVRSAIAAGQYRFFDGDGGFPSRLWYVEDGQGWEAYCINRSLGDYKGWPVDEEELRAFRD